MSDEAERGQTYVPLPDRGPGSPAGWSRRIGALVIDWICGNAAAFLVGGGAVWQPGSGWLIWLPLLCWLILVWAATGLLGASPGQLLLGLRVIRVDRQPVGVVQIGRASCRGRGWSSEVAGRCRERGVTVREGRRGSNSMALLQ